MFDIIICDFIELMVCHPSAFLCTVEVFESFHKRLSSSGATDIQSGGLSLPDEWHRSLPSI